MVQRTKHKNGARSGLVTAVDVGSTKIACFIGQPLDNGGVEIVGIGHQLARGMRNGNIVDMDAVEHSIRTAVESAEQLAGENVSNVTVCVSGGVPDSKLISFDISISGHEIGDADLKRALDPTWLHAQQSADRQVIHTLPVGYSIDGNRGVRDPRGMFGEKLGVNMHIMTAAAGAMRNLESCIHRCHLEIESFVIAPYAAGLSCLVPDEKNLGAICIDMGGGTTTVSVFFDGEVLFVDSIPVGGAHVTNDIARGLAIHLVDAERMKALYGSANPSPSDDQELIKVQLVGEEQGETSQVARSMLVGIIRPRLEEIFELVRDKLDETGFNKIAGRRVVLTGGASQLTGVADLASAMLDKQVRLGRPVNIEGLAESVNGPAFSVCAGLIDFALSDQVEAVTPSARSMEVPSGRFGRLGQWLREYI